MLGVVSSVLAIATVALQLSKFAYETISSFRSQRQDVHDIQTDLATLTGVLELVHEQAKASPSDGRLEALRGPLSGCQTILRDIHESLAQCTRHAKDQRESVRTWLKLRYREKSFVEAKERLSSYKATLCIAFDTMSMRDREATQESLQELARLTDRTREELEDQLDQLQEQISTANGSLKATVEADRAHMQLCLKSLEEAQAVRESKAHIVVSENTATGANTHLIAGTDTTQPAFHLSVTHNRAEDGASMAAGVHSAEVLKALLQQSSAPMPVVSIVQMMQRGSFDPHSPAVQELLQRSAEGYRHGPVVTPGRIEEASDPRDRMLPVMREREDTVTGHET